ncbi:hypothetical protein EIP86_002728 [Pleurotus ostreatoroseus]|nr:hypothetical protein EIP86_002728 [Pleurotus ostreatoroseus]
MPRLAGRKNDEMRKISVVYEKLDRVDGSARFGFGETQSIASVSGPIEVRANSESPSQATLEVHVRPLASIPGTDSKALSAILKSILTPSLLLSQHPRTLVQIVGQALCGNESGAGSGSAGRGWHASLVASLVNACSAALIDASSIPMKGVVCAVAVGRILDRDSPSSKPTLVVDPSEAELAEMAGGGCFAFMFSATLPQTAISQDGFPPNTLLWTNYTAKSGIFDDDEFRQARQSAEQSALQVWKSLKSSLQKVQGPVRQENNDAHLSDDERMEI